MPDPRFTHEHLEWLTSLRNRVAAIEVTVSTQSKHSDNSIEQSNESPNVPPPAEQ
jgi:hypothetical protein